MRRSEVWQVDIPFVPGHGQAGQRPAVIVQDDAFINSLPTVLIVPFTGAKGAKRFPGTVLVQPDAQNGLSMPSVALVFQIRALDKQYFLSRLGVLDTATLDQIFVEMDTLTGR